MQIDLTKIGDVEARRKCLELWKQQSALEDKRPSRNSGRHTWDRDTWSEELRAAWQRYEELRLAEFAKASAANEEADREIDAQIDAIDQQIDALAVPRTPEWDDDGSPRLCALTGLPIFESDDVIKDEETGEWILRAVLPFPEPAGEKEEAA